MEDCYEGTCIHIGHAIMDLRYHAGGSQVQTWTPVFEEITAVMEFFPMDVEVEAGHSIKLTLRSTCLLYTSPSPRDGLLSRMPSSA